MADLQEPFRYVKDLQGQLLVRNPALSSADGERTFQSGSGDFHEDISSQTYKTSIARIRASENLNPNISYITYDHKIPGEWILDPSDTISVDDGVTVLVTADGKRLKNNFSGAIDVTRKGVDKTGSSDAQSIIQSLLDDFDDIYIPPGVYRLDNSIRFRRPNQTIWGDGFSTKFLVTGEFSAIVGDKSENCKLRNIYVDGQNLGLDSAGLIRATGSQNFLVEGCYVANGGNKVNGIAISAPITDPTYNDGRVWGIIRNCAVYNTGKAGIYAATGSEGCIIEGNKVWHIGYNNDDFNVPCIQAIGGHHIKIIGNHCEDSLREGIACLTGAGYNTAAEDYARFPVISGNTIKNCQRGISILHDDGNDQDAIYRSRSATITGNTIRNCVQEGIILRNINNVTITGNAIHNADRGIRLETCYGITIGNNALSDIGGRIIDLPEKCRNIIVTSNTHELVENIDLPQNGISASQTVGLTISNNSWESTSDLLFQIENLHTFGNSWEPKITYSDTGPTNARTYGLGDRIYRITPIIGGHEGWICILGGINQSPLGWSSGVSIPLNQRRIYEGRIYEAVSSGNTGSTPPTHTSGIVSDGGVDWLFINYKAEFKEFGNIGDNTQIEITGTTVDLSLGTDFWKEITANLTMALSNASDGKKASISIRNTGASPATVDITSVPFPDGATNEIPAAGRAHISLKQINGIMDASIVIYS